MIIDAHAHAMGDFAKKDSLLNILKENNVDKIVLCPGGSVDDPTDQPGFIPRFKKPNFIISNPTLLFLSNRFLKRSHKSGSHEVSINNEFIYNLRKKLPSKIIQYYWVDIEKEDILNQVKEDYEKWKFDGLKLHQCITPFSIENQIFDKLANFASSKNLPIFIHIFSQKEAKKFVNFTKKHPKTIFTIAHLMGLETFIDADYSVGNVYFDISPYYIISKKRIYKVIKHFGISHVILGSDSPIGLDNLANNIKKIKNMNLTLIEKEMILGKNIANILNI